jgi:hypothetical protein
VNSFVGGILIAAVLVDIWIRQGGLLDRLGKRRNPVTRRTADA